MNTVQRVVLRCLARLLIRRHVTPLAFPRSPIPIGDPAAIVSPVPDVRIDLGRGRFAGRRKRLRLVHDSAAVEILTRYRPVPATPDGTRLRVFDGLDARGRSIPISCVDVTTRTVHLLFELESLTASPGTSFGQQQLDVLVAAAFARPIDALLDDAGETWIGNEVRQRIPSVLAAQPKHARRRLVRELDLLAMLHHPRPLGHLARRMEEMRSKLRAPTPDRPSPAKVDPRIVEREISRLQPLFRSRALAALRFDESSMTGVLNPRPFDARLGSGARMFRLWLGDDELWPQLQFCHPREELTRRLHCVCLGRGSHILNRIHKRKDLHGMVEVIGAFADEPVNNIYPFRLDVDDDSMDRWIDRWLPPADTPEAA